jgi:hypothetical protein
MANFSFFDQQQTLRKSNIMKTNVHSVERIVRVLLGLALAAMAFWGPANLWFLLGLVLVATGLIGWCPPYAMLGISTFKIGKN